MVKIYINKPVVYEYRIYQRPRSTRGQKSVWNVVNREQQKRARLMQEHLFPVKGRRSNAQYFSKKKSPFGKFQAHSLNQDNINLPENWPYPNYFQLERTRLEDKHGELEPFQMGEDVRLGPEKQSESLLIENIKKNDDNIKHFHTSKWKEFKNSNTSTSLPLDEESIKAILSIVIQYSAKKLDKDIKLPLYPFATNKDKSETLKNQAEAIMYNFEAENHKMDALLKRKDIFRVSIDFYTEIVNQISTKRLKFMATTLQSTDVAEQSFDNSTQALPGLLDNACKSFSQPIKPGYARDQVSLLIGIMCPNPLVDAKTDKEKIWQFLKLEGTQACLWVEEAFEQEKAINKKDVEEKIHFFRTRNRLNYVNRVFKKIWQELKPEIENGDIHCNYPDWQQELKAGIERIASSELGRIKTRRGQNQLAIQQLNRLQAAKQPTDMFSLD